MERVHGQRLPDAFVHNVAAGGGGDRLDLLSGALGVAGEQGQGCQRTAGAAIQPRALREVIAQGLQGTRREADNGLFVALADDDGAAFVPVNIAAAQRTGFMDAQPGVGQGQ